MGYLSYPYGGYMNKGLIIGFLSLVAGVNALPMAHVSVADKWLGRTPKIKICLPGRITQATYEPITMLQAIEDSLQRLFAGKTTKVSFKCEEKTLGIKEEYARKPLCKVDSLPLYDEIPTTLLGEKLKLACPTPKAATYWNCQMVEGSDLPPSFDEDYILDSVSDELSDPDFMPQQQPATWNDQMVAPCNMPPTFDENYLILDTVLEELSTRDSDK